MIKIYTALLVILFSINVFSKDVVALVPGFFNAFAPEYFSDEIITTFEDAGFTVYVIKGLDPVGTIEENGKALTLQLREIQKNENGKINIVAHSAGGFYSLYALQNTDIIIKNLVTISTPYLGLDFLEAWRKNSSLFTELTNISSLSGLRQLTPKYVEQFIKTVRVPDSLKIMTYGGWQPKGLDIWNAKNLSGLLRVTDHFIPGDSDGIVGFKSSLGIHGFLTTENKAAKMYVDKNFLIPLEHWEQVLGYRNFLLLGIRNIGVIRDRQILFYKKIADDIKKN